MAKRFRPSYFREKDEHLFKFGTMSMVYWDMAEEFRRVASEDLQENFYSRLAIPAIIIYCSTVEALINEQLAIQEAYTDDEDLQSEISRLKEENLQRKIKPAFKLFANGAQNLSENVVGNFIALVQLRNDFIHFRPDWDANLFDWPLRLKAAYERSKRELVDSDWTIYFNTKPILDWSEETTRAILNVFLDVTKGDKKRFFTNRI
ncbi:MAG TPA: hypothetical protein VKP65_20905 [Rhodothermales bacterium]|nr:hypothetical protein [Rhodothermales bacterium]